MKLEWRDIPTYEGLYKVSNDGQVLSLNYGGRKGVVQRMVPSLAGKRRDYETLVLSKDGKTRNWYVHALVMLAFIGPRPEGYEVAHLNGNARDNRLENLSYVTKLENVSHTIEHGTRIRGQRHWFNKLSESEVLEIVRRLDEGESQTVLSDEFGVGTRAISKINVGYTWSWLTGRGNSSSL